MTDNQIVNTIRVIKLFRLFPDEDSCYCWLEAARWNGQPIYPHCGGVGKIRLNEGSCEGDTIERMESLASRIGNKRLPYTKLVRKNGLSSTVVLV